MVINIDNISDKAVNLKLQSRTLTNGRFEFRINNLMSEGSMVALDEFFTIRAKSDTTIGLGFQGQRSFFGNSLNLKLLITEREKDSPIINGILPVNKIR